jgi:malonyl-CoA/methylmalonyl-CoA synthetase
MVLFADCVIDICMHPETRPRNSMPKASSRPETLRSDKTAGSSSREEPTWTVSVVSLFSKQVLTRSSDNLKVFKFYTYKVPRLLVESRLLALPYLTEGYVLPVQDPQCDSRVAVLIRTNAKADKVDLGKIRSDLSVQLPAYQLPTVLRVLRDDETVPRTWSDKTAMAKAINLFFPQDAEQNMVGTDVEVMDVGDFMKAKTQKMWDLSGMR